MLSKNMIIELELTDLNNLGYGVGRHEGMVVFVSGGVPGDLASVKIIKVTPSYSVGRIESVIRPSRDRISNDCNARGCGGCIYRNISYDRELSLKRDSVVAALRSQGLGDCEVAETVTTRVIDGYRNKAQYPVSFDGGRYKVGFFAPKSHRVTGEGYGSCRLAPSVFEEISRELIGLFEKYRPSVYSEESGEGLLRHIYLRRGETTGEILLTLVINGSSLPYAEEYVSRLTSRFPSIVGILLNINRRKTNVICGDKYVTLYGRNYIEDRLCDVALRIGPAAFYQVNRSCAELLYGHAAKMAEIGKEDRLLDLYCGIGSIGLAMAKAVGGVGQLIGVEISPEAVDCARENAARANLGEARFYASDASELAGILDLPENREYAASRLTVVLDPPRAGCTEKLLDILTALDIQRIVYISCNPRTLARDVAYLASGGFTPGIFTPFDMFPRTGHVETVVLLSKGEIDSKKVRVEFSLEGMDMSGFQKDATYGQIKERVLEQTGLKVSSLYIAQVKQKHGIIERENYNKPKSENARQPQCPPEKEQAIEEALKYFGMIK